VKSNMEPGPHLLGRPKQGQGFEFGSEFDDSLQTAHGFLKQHAMQLGNAGQPSRLWRHLPAAIPWRFPFP
jgi:hypothetical protein